MNTIIFAAGGGNDVFSAIAYIKATQKKNVTLISILGLTPFHNINNGTIEPPYIIPTTTMSRYIVTNPPKKIFCMESLIPTVLNDEVKHYMCISPKYSSIEQSIHLNELFKSWGMSKENTEIEIVDFGGDILTDEHQSIISPELDAYTLAVVDKLGYNTKVIVCFPGVDGELSAEYLTSCCNNAINIPLNKDLWLSALLAIYETVKKYRPGNTIPNMIKVLNEQDELELNKHWIINQEKVMYHKKININWSLQSHLWVFDLKTLMTTNIYTTVFNQPDYDLLMLKNYIVDIYSRQITNNYLKSSDLFLQYLRLDDTGKYTNKQLNHSDKEHILYIHELPSCVNLL